ncbi:MAG: DUF5946 family protein [Caldilineaceae bacterium]
MYAPNVAHPWSMGWIAGGSWGRSLLGSGKIPDLMAQHFLTVASYNLQHPAQFTAEALAGLRQQFIDYLDHGVPPHEIRRRVASMAEGKVKVHRPEAARRLVLRRWPMTIAAVYLPNPSGAAA